MMACPERVLPCLMPHHFRTVYGQNRQVSIGAHHRIADCAGGADDEASDEDLAIPHLEARPDEFPPSA